MLGLCLAAEVEDEAPGKIGDVAVYLGVEEVAAADKASGEGNRDAQTVHDPKEIEIVVLAVFVRVPPHCEYQGDGASVAGETALPGHEYLQEPLPAAEIIVGLIEYAVAQTRAHNRRNQKSVQKRIEDFLVHAFAAHEPAEDIPADHESCDEQEGIIPDAQTPDVEEDWIDVPMYEKKVCHFVMSLRNKYTKTNNNVYLYHFFAWTCMRVCFLQ